MKRENTIEQEQKQMDKYERNKRLNRLALRSQAYAYAKNLSNNADSIYVLRNQMDLEETRNRMDELVVCTGDLLRRLHEEMQNASQDVYKDMP